MAGIYADIPGTRFALDQDGSVVKWRNFTTSSAWTDVSASIAESQKVNTANYVALGSSSTSANYHQIAVAFPEARTINGIYAHIGFSVATVIPQNITWEYSTNTTDGTDGSWSTFTVTFTTLTSHDEVGENSKPYYRSDIATVSLSNVTGIRVRWNGNNGSPFEYRAYVLHIYGSRPITGVNRLAFWNPSTDNALTAAYLDFGDIAQGTTVTRQFRIKNLSGTLTANSISIAVSDLLPEYSSGGVEVSTDNVVYASSVNIGNLASGVISSTLYVRRTVPGAETTTQRHARLLANAASWT